MLIDLFQSQQDWSVGKGVRHLDQGLLDDVISVEHDDELTGQIEAEDVAVARPPGPELAPRVLLHEMEVAEEEEGGAWARGGGHGGGAWKATAARTAPAIPAPTRSLCPRARCC